VQFRRSRSASRREPGFSVVTVPVFTVHVVLPAVTVKVCIICREVEDRRRRQRSSGRRSPRRRGDGPAGGRALRLEHERGIHGRVDRLALMASTRVPSTRARMSRWLIAHFSRISLTLEIWTSALRAHQHADDDLCHVVVAWIEVGRGEGHIAEPHSTVMLPVRGNNQAVESGNPDIRDAELREGGIVHVAIGEGGADGHFRRLGGARRRGGERRPPPGKPDSLSVVQTVRLRAAFAVILGIRLHGHHDLTLVVRAGHHTGSLTGLAEHGKRMAARIAMMAMTTSVR